MEEFAGGILRILLNECQQNVILASYSQKYNLKIRKTNKQTKKIPKLNMGKM